MLSLYDQILNDAIAVSGVPRSGTSIVTKLLASADKTEIAYEPPMAEILDFMAQNGTLSTVEINTLWKTYVSEHYVLEAALGRGLNIREGEYSSFLEYKSYSELSRRLEIRGGAFHAAEHVGRERPILAFKLVSNWDLLSALISESPSLRAVEVIRCPWQVTASISKKGWFDPERDELTHLPGHGNFFGEIAPYRCSRKLSEDWRSISNEERSARYIIELNRQRSIFLTRFKAVAKIEYEKFTKSPSQTKSHLFEQLRLEDGPNTGAVLETISPSASSSSRNAKSFLKGKLSSESAKKLEEISASDQEFLSGD